MGSLGNAVFDLAEKGVAKYGGPIAEDALHQISKTFSLESNLTGQSGKDLAEHLKLFEKTRDTEMAKIIPQHTAAIRAGGAPVATPGDLSVAATKKARQATMGKNDQVLGGFVKAIQQEHGDTKAKNIVDQLGVYFHEKAYPGGSNLANNLNRNTLTKDIGFGPSKYTPPTPFEQAIKKGATAALAYKAGAAHATTNLNMLMDGSLKSYAYGMSHMFGQSYEGAKAQLLATNAVGHFFEEEYRQLYEFKTGTLAKYAPGSVGEFLHKNFLIPGISMVRSRTMIAAAKQGEYIAKDMANDLAKGGEVERRAAIELKYLGLDPAVIKSSGLAPEHIQTAMYENVQRKVFLDSGLSRSQMATSSPLGRITMMYHNYGARQANFMLSTIRKEMLEKHDPMSIIKLFATMGIIAPAAGNLMYSLEQQWAGKEHGKFIESLGNREKALFEAKEFGERLEAFTHIAGLGVLTTYSRAAGRAKLAESMLGPVGNAGIEGVQDTVKAVRGDAKPLARDVLHDIPSLGIGSWLSHKYLPSQAEINANKPMTYRRAAAKRAAAVRKARKANRENN